MTRLYPWVTFNVYVADQQSNTVSVIDVATDKVVTTIPVGPQPTVVAVTPGGGKAYILNSNLLGNSE